MAYFFYLFNNIRLNIFKNKVKVALSCKIKKSSFEGKNKIGKRSFFRGSLGKCSYIGTDCSLFANIGRFCSISNNVKIVYAQHPQHFVSTSPVFYSTSKPCGFTFAKKNLFCEEIFLNNVEVPCIVGNDVWIGESVLIKGGVVIGNGAIVAMGAVVTKDVPPYAIVGGVPAKIIRYRFEPEIIKKLEDSEWWKREDEWFFANFSLFSNPSKFLLHISNEKRDVG